MNFDDISRFMAPIVRRVMLTVGRATLGPVDDATGLQRGQVTMLAGETRDSVERVQPFGFSSVPFPGADCLVVCVGGNRDHPVIIGTDDRRYRPTGQAPGDVVIYSHQTGHRITLKADRTIEIEGDVLTLKADTKVRIESPLLEVTGEVKDLADSGGMTMAGMRTDYNAHTHAGGPGPTPPMAP